VSAVRKAFERVASFFGDRPTRQALLARQAAGRPHPDDEKLAEILSNERRAASRADGSIGGSLLRTSWAALEMMDLGSDRLHGGLDRLLSWVLGQIEGGHPADPPPVTLPTGITLTDPEHAAIAVRCLGLRALVRAHRGDRPGVASLMNELAEAKGRQPPTLDLSAAVLGALALAPPEHRHHLDGLIARVARAQTAAGDWPDADLLHVLDALLVAGIRPARAVVAKAVPALLKRQRPDGTFDVPPHEERALIGMRAIQVAVEEG
jgi:hypothetical protein